MFVVKIKYFFTGNQYIGIDKKPKFRSCDCKPFLTRKKACNFIEKLKMKISADFEIIEINQ